MKLPLIFIFTIFLDDFYYQFFLCFFLIKKTFHILSLNKITFPNFLNIFDFFISFFFPLFYIFFRFSILALELIFIFFLISINYNLISNFLDLHSFDFKLLVIFTMFFIYIVFVELYYLYIFDPIYHKYFFKLHYVWNFVQKVWDSKVFVKYNDDLYSKMCIWWEL